MPDRSTEIRQEIERLVADGREIILFETAKRLVLGDETAEVSIPKENLAKLKAFKVAPRYQKWYSLALPVVEQLLPDRYAEFVETYKAKASPKQLSLTSYSISHYLAGVVVTQGFDREPTFDPLLVFETQLELQVAIVESALGRLDRLLSNISGTLAADLFDSELDAARELLNKKHLRAAGVVAGVVLEGHLQRVCADHSLTIRKKSPTIGDFNETLKAAGIYDTPTWREVGRYADIRNLSGHAKEREPTPDEISELIAGVTKIAKTVS